MEGHAVLKKAVKLDLWNRLLNFGQLRISLAQYKAWVKLHPTDSKIQTYNGVYRIIKQAQKEGIIDGDPTYADILAARRLIGAYAGFESFDVLLAHEKGYPGQAVRVDSDVKITIGVKEPHAPDVPVKQLPPDTPLGGGLVLNRGALNGNN